MAVSRSTWLGTIGIALGMWLAASALESFAVAMTLRWVGDQILLGTILSTLLGMLSMVGGGYLAARLRPGAASVMAAIVLIVVVALMLADDESPLWYQLTFLLVGPLGPLLGGALAGRRQFRPL
jgi:hypothetical protein